MRLIAITFLYKALECIAKFVHYSDSVRVDGEILIHLHRFEVWTKTAIIATLGDGNMYLSKGDDKTRWRYWLVRGN